MNIPTHCPKCKGPLTNDFYEDRKGNYFIKRCRTRPDHQFQCIFDENAPDLKSATVSISMNPLIRVAWRFDECTLSVARGSLEEIIRNNGQEEQLPFFEPDFSNYKKLINKLKLYVTFS